MRDERLVSLAMSMFASAPAVLRIRATGNWGAEADHLRELVETARLESLVHTLDAFIAADFRDAAPLNSMLDDEREHLSIIALIHAGDVALAAPPQRKLAAFILSVVLLLFLAKPFRRIVGGPRPHYHPWDRIPYACAKLAMEIGAIGPARELVRYIYRVLDSYRPWDRAEIKNVLEEWRFLGRTIERRLETAIVNLADDLRESCRPAAENFRAEVGAITWTLGLVPESTIFRASTRGDVLPSRRFFRQLVHHSVSCMGTDGLLQYVWLELKDRRTFCIREHESLFPVINSRYDSVLNLIEEMLGAHPAQAYARNLIGFFRGQIDPVEARAFREMWLGIGRAGVADEVDLSRGLALSLLLTNADDDAWLSLTTQSARQHGGQPEQNLNLRILKTAVSRFYTNERRIGDVATIIDLLERRRANALAYWLDIGSPHPTEEERSRLGVLLDREAHLVTLLRGTYFEMLLPTLPEHYWYHGQSAAGGPDPRTASSRYVEHRADLSRVRGAMRSAASSYITRRADEDVGLRQLVRALDMHAS
ncbi:MAG: hypothetical protein CV089_04170 [Nitrospira sp. WS110]|nr:hypothetical protein [Nitrospira sp. WS110]